MSEENRGAASLPKKPVVHMNELTPRPRKEPVKTFRMLLTENETMPRVLDFFKKNAEMKGGSWDFDFTFFVANQSGDIATMKPDVLKRVHGIVKMVHAEYLKS